MNHSTDDTTNMRLRIDCPNCCEKMYCYQKRKFPSAFTEVNYRCRNATCLGDFVTTFHIARTLRMPEVVRPGFNVELSPVVAARGAMDAVKYLPESSVEETSNKSLSIDCPNCSSKLFCYKKRKLTASLTEVSFRCRNATCLGDFVATVEVARTLQVPKVVRPGFHVALSPVVVVRGMKDAIKYLPVADAPQDLEIIDEAMPQADMFYIGMDEAADEPDQTTHTHYRPPP